MNIHKAGHSIIVKTLIIFIIIGLLSFRLLSGISPIIIVAVLSILLLFVINFFRNPKRNVIIDDHNIIAPSDGKIVVIEETKENEYFKENMIQVSIFMNIFNVHINWFPLNGIVKYFKYHRGNFAAAYLPKSSEENERTTTVIEGKYATILVRQIAGAIARRIVTYTKTGGRASQNKHLGFIKFGSRVDLFLPLDADIKVKIGDKTKGSQTIIAVLKEK